MVVIVHSAKGSTWKKHDYVKKENGRYYYPEGYKNGYTVDSANASAGDEKMEGWESKIHEHISKIVDEHPDLFQSGDDVADNLMRPENFEAFKNTLAALTGIDTDKIPTSELEQMRNKIASHYSGSGSLKKDSKKSDKKEEENLTDKGYPSSTEEYESKKKSSKKKKNSSKKEEQAIGEIGTATSEEPKKEEKSKTTKKKRSDVMAHHGILGMHWGIRRFQPYPSGHKGGKEVGEAAKAKNNASKSQEKSGASSKSTAKSGVKPAKIEIIKPKPPVEKKVVEQQKPKEKPHKTNYKNLKVSEASDEELSKAIRRIELEKRYTDLTKEPKKVNAGMQFVKRVAAQSAENVAKQAATYAMATVINNMVGKKIIGGGDFSGAKGKATGADAFKDAFSKAADTYRSTSGPGSDTIVKLIG